MRATATSAALYERCNVHQGTLSPWNLALYVLIATLCRAISPVRGLRGAQEGIFSLYYPSISLWIGTESNIKHTREFQEHSLNKRDACRTKRMAYGCVEQIVDGTRTLEILLRM